MFYHQIPNLLFELLHLFLLQRVLVFGPPPQTVFCSPKKLILLPLDLGHSQPMLSGRFRR